MEESTHLRTCDPPHRVADHPLKSEAAYAASAHSPLGRTFLPLGILLRLSSLMEHSLRSSVLHPAHQLEIKPKTWKREKEEERKKDRKEGRK